MRKKLLILGLIISAVGGYWLVNNTWIFKSNSSVVEYRNNLISTNEWTQINSSPSISIFLKNLVSLDGILPRPKHLGSSVPDSFYYETIVFKENNEFIKLSGPSPKTESKWRLINDNIIVEDNDDIDLWGGENWFDTNKKVMRLTDSYLVLYYNGYYHEYISKS